MFYWCARLGPLAVNDVGPLGAKALAEALKTNTTLRHLGLGRMLRSTTHCGGAFLMVPPARFWMSFPCNVANAVFGGFWGFNSKFWPKNTNNFFFELLMGQAFLFLQKISRQIIHWKRGIYSFTIGVFSEPPSLGSFGSAKTQSSATGLHSVEISTDLHRWDKIILYVYMFLYFIEYILSSPLLYLALSLGRILRNLGSCGFRCVINHKATGFPKPFVTLFSTKELMQIGPLNNKIKFVCRKGTPCLKSHQKSWLWHCCVGWWGITHNKLLNIGAGRILEPFVGDFLAIGVRLQALPHSLRGWNRVLRTASCGGSAEGQ